LQLEGHEMTSRPASRKHAANPADLPEGTLVELFLRAVDRYQLPDAQMVRGPDGWRSISHAQLLDDVRALAAGLEALGLKRGDRAGLLSENRPEWAMVDYALLCMGALTVPLYATLPGVQLAYILKDSGAKVVFVSNPDQLAKIEEFAAELPELQLIVLFDGQPKSPNTRKLSDIIAQGRSKRPDEQTFRAQAQQARPHDVATLIYTSGTTGHPKGVMLTHYNLFSNVEAQAWLISKGGANLTVSFLPISHVFQRMVDYCFFHNGVPIAYVPSFDDVAQALRELKPTIVCGVPRVYEKMYARILSATGFKRKLVMWAREIALKWAELKLNGKEPGIALGVQHALADRLVYSKIRAVTGGRLHFFVSGSAPLAAQLIYFFYGAGIRILEGYGLTETSPVLCVNRPDAMRVGTVGKPVPGTEIAIAEDGEIMARGPQIMKGYFNNPDATREVIEPDGWFHTGDIGDLDEDGFLSITDRKKELIKTAGGKWVAPQPIENMAKLSRFVADAVLLGDRRPYPILLVIPNFSSLESWAATDGVRWSSRAELVANPTVKKKIESEVFERLKDLARFEMPKKLLILERELDIDRGELTPSLKARRRVVEQNFREGIEGLYESQASEVA
jgi:long-chain acyl-CoA synthetase